MVDESGNKGTAECTFDSQWSVNFEPCRRISSPTHSIPTNLFKEKVSI